MKHRKHEQSPRDRTAQESIPIKILKYSGFPVLLGSVALALSQDSPVLAYVALAVVVAIGWLFERTIPYEMERRIEPGALIQDTTFSIVTLLVGPALGVFLSWTLSRIDLAVTDLTALTWLLQLPLALIVSGFLPYVLHRLAHEKDGILWRAHSIHHAPRSVYWLNALRLHPLNTAWNTTAGLIPLLLLGFDPGIIFMTGVLNNFMSIANHFNADLRLGPLNLIFNSGQLHRWHHNRDLSIANHNYSSGLLIFWDLMFGTYLMPERKQTNSEVGLMNESSYPMTSIKEQLIFPFRGFGTCCPGPGLAA
ncbi:MAG: sterol desaturase family protein [Leptospiraceae bacterium]